MFNQNTFIYSTILTRIFYFQSDNDNNKKPIDSPTGYDGKSDDTIGENESNRKQSPRPSPNRTKPKDLTNGTNTENLPSTNTIMDPSVDTNDNRIPESHLIMNGIPATSAPIPFQRMQTNNQQPQLLLYQQQQQQA